MFKKIALFIFFITLLFPTGLVQASNEKVELYFFGSDTCPHCAKEEIFLDKLEDKYSNYLEIKRYEVSKNRESAKLLMEFGKRLNADISGVPFTVIGDEYIVGYANDQTTGKQIENKVVLAIAAINKNNLPPPPEDKNKELIDIPLLGTIDAKSFSLPVITIVLGFLDGFNPCAMWVLLFLISLLLGMNNRRRMWVLGTTFIVTSAFVYFIFMVAWLNLILFLGFIVWIRIVIGLLALFGGGYSFRKFYKDKDGACEIVEGEKRQKIFEKLKDITQNKKFLAALGGIILLAFAVNLVELFCSAGLPAVYSQVLTLNNLATWQYYAYILLYVFIFMLDDLVIFIIAMVTLKLTGISTKYSRWSSLIGGILMLIIGILLIFKPEWLMFA